MQEENLNISKRSKNLVTLFQAQTYRFGSKPVFSHKKENEWITLSWEELGACVEKFGRGLMALGIQPGDRVAIFSTNCPEWVMADLAILSLGAVSVPIYPNTTADQAEFILNHSESKVVFLSQQEGEKAVGQIRSKLTALKASVIFQDAECTEPNVFSLPQFELKATAVSPVQFYDRLEKVGAEDLATIVYTSGTTGEPKGVMLTHKNILSNCIASASVFPLSETDVCLSYLPLSHTLERTAGLYTMLYVGAQIAFAESIARVAQNLAEVKPTFLISVPRILEKIYGKIQSEIEGKPRPLRYLFRKATSGPSMFNGVYENLFYKKIRDQLGGNIRYMICGGAAMSPVIGKFFRNVGFNILEGYGLTEASPIVAVNLPQKNKLGTVGPALPGIEIRIAEDGEVLVRGPNVMKGYFKDEKATSESIDPRGFLRTGDIGVLDEEGFLKLTDRKKELIVTSGGKNIAPAKIENALKAYSLIEHVCVVGDGQKYIAALIVPNFHQLEDKAELAGFTWKNRGELVNLPKIREWYNSIVDEVNKTLPSFESVKKYALLPDDFTIEKGEITPSLKLKRKEIRRLYKSIIDSLFV